MGIALQDNTKKYYNTIYHTIYDTMHVQEESELEKHSQYSNPNNTRWTEHSIYVLTTMALW